MHCRAIPAHVLAGLGSCTLFQSSPAVFYCSVCIYLLPINTINTIEYPHHPMLHLLLCMHYYQTIADVCMFSVWAMSNDAMYPIRLHVNL